MIASRFTRHAVLAGVASIGAAAGGCGETGRSAAIAANDVSSAPATAPAGVTAKLAQLVDDAAGGHGAGPHIHFHAATRCPASPTST